MNGLELKNLRKEAGLTQEELGKLIGTTKRTIISYEKEGGIPESKVLLLNHIFENLNKSEVLEPKSQYLTNKNGNRVKELSNGHYKVYLRKITVSKFSSYLENYQNIKFLVECEETSFFTDHLEKGSYLCFEVEGEGMNGAKINDSPVGADLFCVEYHLSFLKKNFISKYGWIIVHKNTILFNDISNYDISKNEITCSSRSGLPQHPEFKINLDDIRQLFKVNKRTF